MKILGASNGLPELGKIQIRTAYEFLKRTGHI